jgi:hypothetical protein
VDKPWGCLLQTRSWLVSQAQRLVDARKLLERELAKFTYVTPSLERFLRHYDKGDEPFFEFHNPISPQRSSRGEMNLRRLIEEVQPIASCCAPEPSRARR